MIKLLLFQVLIPIFLCAQEFPKGANKIVVSTRNSPSENFANVKRVLAADGIEIAKQDAEVLQIKTGTVKASNEKASCYFIITCNGNEIIIRGMYKTGLTREIGLGISQESEYQTIQNFGKSRSPYKDPFITMNDIALSLHGDKLRYEVSKL